MKIGLCVIDMPASLGGGYVFRESVAQAALANPGRHTVDLVRARPRPKRFADTSIGGSVGQAIARGGIAAVLNPARVKKGVRQIAGKLARAGMGRSAPQIDSQLRSYVDWAIEQRLTWPNPDMIREFEEDIAKKNYDLLWFNNIEPIHVGIPYIFNVFDLQHRLQPWFPEVSDKGQFRLREGCYGEAMQRAAFVITSSEETKSQVSLFYGVPADRIRVIHFPTPQPAIEAAASTERPKMSEAELRAKYGIEGPYLYYPAQFWPHKNHVNLLHGLKALRDVHGLNFSMVFTGADHGNATFVKAEAQRLGVADKVHFGGFVSYDEVAALYRHAFAMTYVTFFGPDNLPPLEAFSFGCPVVLSNIPGIEMLFEDAVVPVDPRDGMSIAEGVKRLLDDPAGREYRIAKGRTIANRNSVSNYFVQVQALFDEFEAVRRCWP
jgi:glycosyltransferase involved in cell wall biosynthesis